MKKKGCGIAETDQAFSKILNTDADYKTQNAPFCKENVKSAKICASDPSTQNKRVPCGPAALILRRYGNGRYGTV
jgi:hypothetical protein